MTITPSNKPANGSNGIAGQQPYRVMVVDDSAVVRGLIARMLTSDSQIEVITTVANGKSAIDALGRYDVEICVLDIEMPVMDGLTALPQMLGKDPNLKVIMASTLTLKNASISIKALQAGAADYIPKPTSSREISTGTDFKTELLSKVKALGAARRRITRGQPRKSDTNALRTSAPVSRKPALQPSKPADIKLRDPMTVRPDIIAIGSSTGGPQALFKVFGDLRSANITQPIVVTQHMPATFTRILGEHITGVSGKQAAEAIDGEKVMQNRIYVAPGGRHLTIVQKGPERFIKLTDTPPENFCKPAVDPMLRSIAPIYGKRVLTVILTGMGSDGLKGGQEIIKTGGTVVAQDEGTSVVWGMPGAVAQAGICSAILPLSDIAPYIKRIAMRAA